MKTIFKLIIVLIILAIIGVTVLSSVLILAEDESEGGIPGVDMAATWNMTGFTWIYPGSTHDASGCTLHNIHMMDGNPYVHAKEMMENTYGISPHIIVIVNDKAAEKIFGGDIVSDIREYNWGQGYSRGNAVEKSMGDFNLNPLQILPCILTGDIHFAIV
ncbi:MAG: hypothetical protein MJ209_01515 [archaeon]|nr:hypothetical protein [archaeon]